MPHMHYVLCCTGDEDRGVERVPHDSIHWCLVRAVGHQEVSGVLCCGHVDVSIISTNKEQVLLVWFECNAPGTLHHVPGHIVRVLQPCSEVQNQLVTMP